MNGTHLFSSSHRALTALLVLLFATVLSPLCPMTASAAPGTEASVTAACERWAGAIASRDPDKIVALYDPNAVLWATFSTTRFSTHKEIRNYFVKLTKRENLQAKFTSHLVRMYGDVAIDTGYYYFSFTENGKKVKLPARYTFVFKRKGSDWKIIEHHSSVVPGH